MKLFLKGINGSDWFSLSPIEQDCFSKRRWSDLLKLIEHTHKSAMNKCVAGEFMWTWLRRQLVSVYNAFLTACSMTLRTLTIFIVYFRNECSFWVVRSGKPTPSVEGSGAAETKPCRFHFCRGKCHVSKEKWNKYISECWKWCVSQANTKCVVLCRVPWWRLWRLVIGFCWTRSISPAQKLWNVSVDCWRALRDLLCWWTEGACLRFLLFVFLFHTRKKVNKSKPVLWTSRLWERDILNVTFAEIPSQLYDTRTLGCSRAWTQPRTLGRRTCHQDWGTGSRNSS